MIKPDHIVNLCVSGIHLNPLLRPEQKTWLAMRARQQDNSQSQQMRLVVNKKIQEKGGK